MIKKIYFNLTKIGSIKKNFFYMYKNKKIIAIIPARSGSKGLKNKNIKLFNNKPLIQWTIEAAKNSKYIDKLIISTDSYHYGKLAIKMGAEFPFLRPKNISGDNSPSYKLIVHALKFYLNKNDFYDYIVLLEPTSPLRKKKDIDNCIKLLVDSPKAKSLVTIGKITREHPRLIQKILKNGFLSPYILNKKEILQRQELELVFFPYGVVYISEVKEFLKTKKIYGNQTISYLLSPFQHFEIDTIEDFLISEKIQKEL